MDMARNKKSPGIDLELLSVKTSADSETAKIQKQLKEAHDAEFAMAMKDIWYFAKHVQTFDEETEDYRFWPDFQYLRDVNTEVDLHRRVIVKKSRRLLLSWLGMLRQLHRAMRAGTKVEGVANVYRGAVMSIGEVEAKHLMSRITAMYKKLPQWMQDRNPMVVDNTLHKAFACGGEVHAFALKRDGPRTFGFTEVFFDEMAFQEAARQVWMGMMPTIGAKGIVFAVSTPNGRSNLFHDVYVNRDNKYPDIHRIWIPHTENPEHGDEWLRHATKALDQQMIAREYHGSFAAYAGNPVWNKYDPVTHEIPKEVEIKIYTEKPVYIGWDLGFHYPACTVWQRNNRDQWVGFMEFQGYDIEFGDFCKKVKEKMNVELGNRNTFKEIHFMPPDAAMSYHQKSKSGSMNDIQEVKSSFGKFGKQAQVRISPGEVGTRDNEAPRMKVTRKLWNLRADGNPGIALSKDMNFFIEGCNSGYCYPETNNTQKGSTEQPLKNEYSHLQDSAQAVFAGYDKMLKPPEEVSRETRPKRKRIGHRTGL